MLTNNLFLKKLYVFFCFSICYFVITNIAIIFIINMPNNHKSLTAQGLNIKKYLGLDKPELSSYDGQNITIAIIDSGINKHNDINSNRITIFKDFTSENSIPYDDNGHGTFIAWIIGADGKMEGIAPKSNFVIIKALDSNGKTDNGTLMKAFKWTYDNIEKYNIKVLNISIGVKAYLEYKDDPICSIIEKISNKDVVIVCAAGNVDDNSNTNDILSPGISPSVITVGSCKNSRTYTLSDDKITSFSPQGKDFLKYIKPDLVTLGVDISSIDFRNNNGYVIKSGTSFSCAIVSGLACLLWSKYSYHSSYEIKKIIVENTIRLKEQSILSQGHGELYFRDPPTSSGAK